MPDTATSGRKRKSAQQEAAGDRPAKRATRAPRSTATKRESDASSSRGTGSNNTAPPPPPSKPRLTTPDLEFDWDRSQLRDPRPTPGRVRRPRHDEFSLARERGPEWRDQYHIPEPPKPPGRLNRFQKDELHREKGLLDPSACFHNLYVCHRKGRDGSPTYDSSGFQLDWNKVDSWMKPQAYSKSGAVRGMERSLARHKIEQRSFADTFFVPGTCPEMSDFEFQAEDYTKDHISKDLGIPWHQIGVEQAREWERQGFPKVDAKVWWRQPNEEEKKRMLSLLSGGSLRKDL